MAVRPNRVGPNVFLDPNVRSAIIEPKDNFNDEFRAR